MRRLVIALSLVLFVSVPSFAEQASKESVLKLMELTGSKNIGEQMLSQMVAAMKKVSTDVPESFWTEFVRQADFDELMDMIVPIYQKYLTQQEIDKAIAFFSSAEGKKIASTQPMIIQESVQAGQLWGQKTAQKAMSKMDKAKP